MIKQTYIAHVRESDKELQSVEQHLNETAALTGLFATVIKMPLAGKLLGLVHDIGKYSREFQNYIHNITGLKGIAKREQAKAEQGKIDHATSGAQYIWKKINRVTQPEQMLAQILCVIIMSHHSRTGIKDFIHLEGSSPFLARLKREDEKTHLKEALCNADTKILEEIDRILDARELQKEFIVIARRIKLGTNSKTTRLVSYSLLNRFLFSCLLDADRLSTANFENKRSARFRTTGIIPDWNKHLKKFEEYIAGFKPDSRINKIRVQISQECLQAANKTGNLHALSVPTGGGKTLASLRFALHRAANSKSPQIERIIYVIPYTSIVDQNADEIRKILGNENILEHHSNLSEEKDTWRNRVLSENWDAPIVFTTTVQFLNSLFEQGTNSARRMHQLANAILIFDEIQNLPIKTIHLFNNSINFLTQFCNTCVLLCTATMPRLQDVDAVKGALKLTTQSDIISTKADLFKKLKRVKVIDKCRNKGWSHKEVSEFALDCQAKHKSLLIVCNTKDSAQRLFELIKTTNFPTVHLSTNMCPAHRKYKISQIKEKLDPKVSQPVICISTQLIEAGIDLDFGCVIRSLAGLDSIIQAGGRCNRHGHRKEKGNVYILNFNEEPLHTSLKEIKEAQDITKRLLADFKKRPEDFEHDLLSDKAMRYFYDYYFYRRSVEMDYPLKASKGTPPLSQNTSILSLLGINEESKEPSRRKNSVDALRLPLQQAYSTAAQAFRVIDAPTQGILVPYDFNGYEGSRIIADLSAAYSNDLHSLEQQVRLHKQSQQYTVNAFPNIIKELAETGALRELQPESGIFYLDERYYNDDLGITIEVSSKQQFYNVSDDT